MKGDTVHLSAQTRADLEELLAEQDRGWCAYNNVAGTKAIETGIGGCLVQQMDRLLFRQGLSRDDRQERRHAMIRALGFTIEKQGKVWANPMAMFCWNDEQRDPDVIRHRIKDALNA